LESIIFKKGIEFNFMIALCIMGEKGLSVLQGVINQHGAACISMVVVAKDTNVINDFSNEITDCCIKHHINFHYRGQSVTTDAPYVIAVSWRWLLPVVPHQKIIVLHDSLLPRYRGFAPLVSALINGETSVGVTALFASESYDTGDVISQSAITIAYPITIKRVIEMISAIYVALVVDIVEKVKSNIPLMAVPQNEQNASYSLWRDDEDYFIDWHKSSFEIRRLIDAVGYPYLGAVCTIDGIVCQVTEAEEAADVEIENRDAGKVIFMDKGCPVVVCGSGLLKITGLLNNQTKQSMLPLKKFRTRFC
jgi:methionyl-tRNA formyltransferase